MKWKIDGELRYACLHIRHSGLAVKGCYKENGKSIFISEGI